MRRWRIYNSVDNKWGEMPYDSHQAAQCAAEFWNSKNKGSKWKPIEFECLAIAQAE